MTRSTDFLRELFAVNSRSTELAPDQRPASTEPPTDRLQLGAHAKRLLDDPVLALAFDILTDDLAAAWRDSKIADDAKREDAYRMVKAIEAVKSRLQGLADNAKVLQAEQERREKEEERKRERAA
jgi:hypothetical protein